SAAALDRNSRRRRAGPPLSKRSGAVDGCIRSPGLARAVTVPSRTTRDRRGRQRCDNLTARASAPCARGESGPPCQSIKEPMMAVMRRAGKYLGAAIALLAAIGLSNRLDAQELTVGITGSSSDAPFFIADKKGYFADEGLKVKLIRFDSAAKMIPSLGTGELDVGSGATSSGLYNAAKRGVAIKIVADKARNAKGYGFQSILVRKDLAEAGKVKSLKDFHGLKVALSAIGNSEAALLDIALKRGGLSFADIEPVYLGFPQHTAAFQNGAIDASLTVEPTTSQILKLGNAVKLIGADEVYPDYQTAVTFYGANFIKNKPEAAQKFMKGLVRGMRFYNDALHEGKIAGANADEVVAILV